MNRERAARPTRVVTAKPSSCCTHSPYLPRSYALLLRCNCVRGLPRARTRLHTRVKKRKGMRNYGRQSERASDWRGDSAARSTMQYCNRQAFASLPFLAPLPSSTPHDSIQCHSISQCNAHAAAYRRVSPGYSRPGVSRALSVPRVTGASIKAREYGTSVSRFYIHRFHFSVTLCRLYS